MSAGLFALFLLAAKARPDQCARGRLAKHCLGPGNWRLSKPAPLQIRPLPRIAASVVRSTTTRKEGGTSIVPIEIQGALRSHRNHPRTDCPPPLRSGKDTLPCRPVEE